MKLEFRKNKLNLIKSVVFCGIALMIISFVDYYVDAYASVRITYTEIAEDLENGNVILGTDIPLSERKMKWACVNNMEKKDFVILGSSRSAMFTADRFTEESFYNMWQSGGATVNDYLAEVYLLYSQNKLPERMLIEISPSVFNINSGEQRWLEWEDNVSCMRMLLDEDTNAMSYGQTLGIGWTDLVSPSYFQYNFEELLKGNRVWIRKTQESENADYNVHWSDGSLMYSREFTKRYSAEQITDLTDEICEDKSIYCCSDYNELDVVYQENFEKLIAFLIERGVEVSFYLPPYSEPMYHCVITDEAYAMIPEVERYILQFADENQLKVYGSFDPEGSTLELSDFYDPYHIRREKIMDTLWLRGE